MSDTFSIRCPPEWTKKYRLLFIPTPDAGLCFDIGQARPVDPAMAEAQTIRNL